MGHKVDNKFDLYLDKNMYKALLKRAGLNAPKMWSKIQEKYQIEASYKTIAQAINGNNSWKLLYAWAICKELNTTIDILFNLKEVDEVEREKRRTYRKAISDRTRPHTITINRGNGLQTNGSKIEQKAVGKN